MSASGRPSVWDVWEQIVSEPAIKKTSDGYSIEGEDNGNESEIDVVLVSEEEDTIDDEIVPAQEDGHDDTDMNEIIWSEANQDSDITERRPQDGTMKQITRPRIIKNYQGMLS
ncbi:Hypothetical predicted protein [Mytilus galloprovincialis]|uniref:Uncharacterized protein n=1 Tax=Mytilus galloprovincialis TaxID=29158 RepID=A0A8B6D2A6_MYTGA|nr:Hypothetical predicted protein [Mytilus galloprovincialis]